METVYVVIAVVLATTLISPAQSKGLPEYYPHGPSSLLGIGVQVTAAQRRHEGRASVLKTTEQETGPLPTTVKPPFASKNEELHAGKPPAIQRASTAAGSRGKAKKSADESGRELSENGMGYSNSFRGKTTSQNHGLGVHPSPLKFMGSPPRNDVDPDGGVANSGSLPHHRLASRGTLEGGAPGGGDDSEGVAGGPTARSPSRPRVSGQLVPKGRGRRSSTGTHPPSPCPTVFSYLRAGPSGGKWYGVVRVATDREIVGVRLGIQLDKPAQLLGAWLGEVITEDKKYFTIWNKEKIINPSSPLPVKIMVQYDEKDLQPPRIKTITVNGIQICPVMRGNPDQSPHQPVPKQLQTQSGNNKKLSSSNFGDQEAADVEMVDGVPCGQIDYRPSLLIAHGKPTERGDWPWHAAIYQSTTNNLTYICGGIVIGKKMILTAAHCVSERRGRFDRPVAPGSRVVFLGKYYLTGIEEDTQAKKVEHIYLHPEYSRIGYTADIAVLELSTPIEFTEYVKPVCLWDGNRPHLKDIEGLDGVVVGWGKDESGITTEELMMANMPVVSQNVCTWSNPQFFSQYVSDRTFCAGYRNGTSVCNGDSGGGLYFPKKVPGKKNELVSPLTWTVRGIVSLSARQDITGHCDTKHFVVFSDVAKFYHWIKQYH